MLLMVLRQGFVLVIVGVALGSAAAMALTRSLKACYMMCGRQTYSHLPSQLPC